MGSVRDDIVRKFFRGIDPFLDLPDNCPVDLQGWNSSHPILKQVAVRRDPIVIMEIGVWKGGSTITMAQALKDAGINGVVLAIDTWLGSWENWLIDQYFKDLRILNGYPRLHATFMANVKSAGLQDYVLPVAMDSLNASHALWKFDIRPDVVHLDGGHDYAVVKADLGAWWERLKPGGILVGDDYNVGENAGWQGVRQAFDEFFGALGKRLDHANGKCWIEK